MILFDVSVRFPVSPTLSTVPVETFSGTFRDLQCPWRHHGIRKLLGECPRVGTYQTSPHPPNLSLPLTGSLDVDHSFFGPGLGFKRHVRLRERYHSHAPFIPLLVLSMTSNSQTRSGVRSTRYTEENKVVGSSSPNVRGKVYSYDSSLIDAGWWSIHDCSPKCESRSYEGTLFRGVTRAW